MSYEIADILPALIHARGTVRRHGDPLEDPEVVLWRALLLEDPTTIKDALGDLPSSDDLFVRQVIGVD